RAGRSHREEGQDNKEGRAPLRCARIFTEECHNAYYARFGRKSSHWGKGMKGGKEALDDVAPAMYEELRRLARHYLSGERSVHTLQPTALVHEAYLRLAGQR